MSIETLNVYVGQCIAPVYRDETGKPGIGAKYSYIITNSDLTRSDPAEKAEIIGKAVQYSRKTESFRDLAIEAICDVLRTLLYEYHYHNSVHIYTDVSSVAEMWKNEESSYLASEFAEVEVHHLNYDENRAAEELCNSETYLHMPTGVYMDMLNTIQCGINSTSKNNQSEDKQPAKAHNSDAEEAKLGKVDTPAAHAAKSPANAGKNSKSSTIHVYTDGACSGNPGPGGWAYLIKRDNETVCEAAGGDCGTTNNRMELTAAIQALETLRNEPKTTAISLYSDSKYLVDGITLGWAKSWKENGWRNKQNKPAKNADLWNKLLDLTAKLNVQYIWIKGHADNAYNERCDAMAVRQIKRFA